MAHLIRQNLLRQSGDVGTGVEWCRAGPLVGLARVGIWEEPHWERPVYGLLTS